MVLGIRYWFNHAAKFSYSYCVEADFVSLPTDDRPLEAWLAVQPGVVPDSVIALRNGKRLQVRLLVVQTQAGEPPLPDVDAACAVLGYRGQTAPFQDCPDAD